MGDPSVQTSSGTVVSAAACEAVSEETVETFASHDEVKGDLSWGHVKTVRENLNRWISDYRRWALAHAGIDGFGVEITVETKSDVNLSGISTAPTGISILWITYSDADPSEEGVQVDPLDGPHYFLFDSEGYSTGTDLGLPTGVGADYFYANHYGDSPITRNSWAGPARSFGDEVSGNVISGQEGSAQYFSSVDGDKTQATGALVPSGTGWEGVSYPGQIGSDGLELDAGTSPVAANNAIVDSVGRSDVRKAFKAGSTSVSEQLKKGYQRDIDLSDRWISNVTTGDSDQIRIVSGSGVNAERRAFNPSANDKSGTITMSVRVPDLPNDGTVRWSVPPGARGDIALGNDPNNQQTEVDGQQVTVMGLTPGLTELDVSVLDADDEVVESYKYDLCVPMYVHVQADAGFDTVLTTNNLQQVRKEILQKADETYRRALRSANVRVIWDVKPINETVPAQFRSGGPAHDKLTPATLTNLHPNKTVAGYTTSPSDSYGPNVHDEEINVYLGEYENASKNAAEALGDAASKVLEAAFRADMSSPSIQGVAAKLFGRVTGTVLAHEIGHAMIGEAYGNNNSPGHNPDTNDGGLMRVGHQLSLADWAGLELKPNGPTPADIVNDPSKLENAFNDVGINAIAVPKGAGAQVIDDNFPVPPTFS